MKITLTKYLIPALLLGATCLPLAAQAQRPFYGAGPFHGQRNPFRGGPGPYVGTGTLHWSGDVDETEIIYVHGDQIRDRNVRGKGVSDENVDFQGRLSHGPASVHLLDWDGRGEVRVIQQPNPDNDFTAAIRIHDPQSGQGHYRFTLAWRPTF
jgi:hypothetical protein